MFYWKKSEVRVSGVCFWMQHQTVKPKGQLAHNPSLASFLQTIESNWRCGRHNLQRIQCRSENSKGVYCLQYDDDKIISGLRDNSIKVSY